MEWNQKVTTVSNLGNSQVCGNKHIPKLPISQRNYRDY